MITAVFFIDKTGVYVGFKVFGHAMCNSGENGSDIVCAGVSSAVMFAANTITDFLGADAEVRSGKNSAELHLHTVKPCAEKPDGSVRAAQASEIIRSLETHLEYLGGQACRYAGENNPNAKKTGICIKKIIEE